MLTGITLTYHHMVHKGSESTGQSFAEEIHVRVRRECIPAFRVGWLVPRIGDNLDLSRFKDHRGSGSFR
jgi:hypothetical protein